MTFSKRMMFLASFLLALFASALWVSCDLGTNAGGDDGDALLSRSGSAVLPKEAGTEEGSYVGTLIVQMDEPILFTITLKLQANNAFDYTSESVRGNTHLVGTYTLTGSTLILEDTDFYLWDEVYTYDGSVIPTTISGNWYLGDAPDPVYKYTVLYKTGSDQVNL
jgi:hypothetical protein